ncbi:MAG TPA: hypothetical protein VK095_15435 [Beutenbergiaceae bacterium]|nr:hypothetical protein [Beutenbergiaceae bacterium]
MMDPITWIVAVCTAAADVALLRPGRLFAGAGTASLVPVAIGVALLAGISTMAGHVVIFSLNRVRGLRLHVALALGGLYLAFLHLLTGVVIAVIVMVVAGEVDPVTIAVAYLLSAAPRVLGFLIFVPHLGLGFGRVLEGWSLLALVFLLPHALVLDRWQTLLLASVAWLLTQVLSRVLGRQVAQVASWVWTRVSGSTTFITAHDILAGSPFVPLGQAPMPGRTGQPAPAEMVGQR